MTTPTVPLAHTLQLYELRTEMLARVEERIHGLLGRERHRWRGVNLRAAVPIEELTRIVEAGGKRIRPALCISGYLAAGGAAGSQLAVDAAAALELLHDSALILDDVMDDSALRRSTETIHTRQLGVHTGNGWHGEPRRFGEAVATLAANLAHVYADRLMVAAPAPAQEIWVELRTELMIGQYLDVRAAAETLTDTGLASWIAICKSGRYTVYRPLVLGAALAGRADLAPAFEEYGLAVGEAFQLRDDLIDASGDSLVTGKPTGSDLDQHKMTVLLSLAAERDEEVRQFLAEGRHDAAELRRLLDRSGAAGAVAERIDELLAKANAAIRQAPLDPVWQEELVQLAYQVTHRDH